MTTSRALADWKAREGRENTSSTVERRSQSDRAREKVGLDWLIRLRWLTLAAQVAAVVTASHASAVAFALLVLFGLTNVAFALLRERFAPPLGAVLVADTALLTLVLHVTGGASNPFTALYFVYITMAAVLLGTRWVVAIFVLSMLGYAALFAAETPHEHHEFESHLRGMWIAFGISAGLIAAFVTRLTRALAKREAELAEERERAGRSAQIAALTSLAAGAAHELGTPIGTIVIAASELERTLKEHGAPEEALEDVRLIREEGKRCRAVLDGLSASTGEARGEGFAAMTLGEVAEETLARLSASQRARVKVEGDGAAEVELPPAALSVALANLIRNALDASEQQMQITLRFELDAERVSFRVVDQGRGMNEEQLARACDPFFTTKGEGRGGEGMGLGLFLVRALAEQLGGALTIESAPERGTVATLSLPRAPRRLT